MTIHDLGELDAAVAEHCMEWVWQSNITYGYTMLVPPDWRQMSNGTQHWIFCPTVGDMNLTIGVYEAEQTCFPRRQCSVPAYSTDPAASYALRQKMREMGFKFDQRDRFDGRVTSCFRSSHGIGQATELNEHTATCLAALRALGVEFTLADNWDQR